LLESYGGHELAAGFTISRSNIPAFREQISALAQAYYKHDGPRTVLDADCTVKPELLTVGSIDSLAQLEPCGNGCAKPVMVVREMTVDRINQVGSGRHMRLRLCSGWHTLQGIFFSTNAQTASINPGDLVDVAFTPQINEFRGDRSVQLNILDIRPSCKVECGDDSAAYRALCQNTITAAQAKDILPDRNTLGLVWRYLAACPGTEIQETPECLCRNIVRWSEQPLSVGKLLACPDVFADVGLINLQHLHKNMTVERLPAIQKADLQASRTLQKLQNLVEE
jgi:single-stranded-DNA-specific exonuclease